MDRIKQSISWWCFAQGDMTIERMVRIAADIGYEAIELVEQDHWQVIKDHGLAIASLKGQSSIEEGFNRREHHDHLEREVRAKIELAPSSIEDRKSTRLNSSHDQISYAVFC